MLRPYSQMIFQRHVLRPEIPRGRKKQQEADGRKDADRPQRIHCDLPGRIGGHQPHADTPGHGAEGRAADIKPHRLAETGRFDLLGKISHGDGGNAAEHEPFQRAGGKQPCPTFRACCNDIGDSGQHHRNEHQISAGEELGKSTAEKNGEGKRSRRQRQGERRGCGVYAEFRRKFRQQRLHAINQRKAGEAGQKERPTRPAKLAASLPDPEHIRRLLRHDDRRGEILFFELAHRVCPFRSQL
ncbi:hypothetical protein D3C71_902880 [compost metagenome]